jgi:D-beta-D-heptose 7-phosphate kinase/D-beta-D-heptose 1-phosphate adenosyltransferase
MKVLVIGESCLDVYQYGVSNRLCPEAPVPVFNSNGSQTSNGGMAQNVYNNMVALCPNASIDIVTNDNWEQITKTRYVDERTNYIILRIDKNEDSYNKENLRKMNFTKYDVVVISDYNKGFLSEHDIDYISSHATTTFLDTKKILGPWCNGVTFIKINDVEYERTKHKLTKSMTDKMIITTGPEGCLYQGERYPVSKVEIKDTSGAGDTFIAALAVEYAKSRQMSVAIKFANHCATAVVQKKGVSVV